jgi:hypothetical protein
VAEERLSGATGSEEPVAPPVLARLVLCGRECSKVRLVLDLLAQAKGAPVTSDLEVAVEHPNESLEATRVSDFLINVCGME